MAPPQPHRGDAADFLTRHFRRRTRRDSKSERARFAVTESLNLSFVEDISSSEIVRHINTFATYGSRVS